MTAPSDAAAAHEDGGHVGTSMHDASVQPAPHDAGHDAGVISACGDHPCEFCTDGETKCDENVLLTCRGSYFAGLQSCGDRALCITG
ncbi:MAG TPA: hypothetical protein VHM19_10760, partial [Polyangiales bacterium]|nr:hypothetical protein [Polyangiales bacterium]